MYFHFTIFDIKDLVDYQCVSLKARESECETKGVIDTFQTEKEGRMREGTNSKVNRKKSYVSHNLFYSHVHTLLPKPKKKQRRLTLFPDGAKKQKVLRGQRSARGLNKTALYWRQYSRRFRLPSFLLREIIGIPCTSQRRPPGIRTESPL